MWLESGSDVLSVGVRVMVRGVVRVRVRIRDMVSVGVWYQSQGRGQGCLGH